MRSYKNRMIVSLSEWLTHGRQGPPLVDGFMRLRAVPQVVAICRCFNYFFSLTFLLFDQIRHLYVDFSLGNIDRDTLVPIPASLRNPKQLASLMLTSSICL